MPRTPGSAVVLVVVVGQAACAAHVQLPRPPPDDAGYPERVAYYDAMKIDRAAQDVRRTEVRDVGGNLLNETRSATDVIVLGNGVRVSSLGDLAAVVPETTAGGKAVRAAAHVETNMAFAGVIVGAGAIGGAGAAVVSAGVFGRGDVALVALGGGAVVAAVGLGGVVMYSMELTGLREGVRETYNDSLAASLRLGE